MPRSPMNKVSPQMPVKGPVGATRGIVVQRDVHIKNNKHVVVGGPASVDNSAGPIREKKPSNILMGKEPQT